MATGLSNAEIATHLYVGMETVKTPRQQLELVPSQQQADRLWLV
jgi:DNA-binding CsgD family transcriptional regulator